MKIKAAPSVLWLAGMLTSVSGMAAPVALACYELELGVDSVEQHGPCTPGGHNSQVFGCIKAGDVFSGRFAVDATILAENGMVSNAPLADFELAFGSALYSTGTDNLTLRGFRNPELGALAPGFLIEGRQVVDLVGGIYGAGDLPFIDMHSSDIPRNRFVAYDGVTRAKGSLAVRRVRQSGACP